MKKPFLGVAYYPEDWDESDIPYDIAKMKEAGIGVARIGEFAWHKMEPVEGQFEFGWLHHVVDSLKENGIRVIMGTPTATPPIWLIRSHPDVALLGSDGIRVRHGGRRHCCSNNPHYIQASRNIVTRLAEEFGRDENIIGWQIDNEIYSFGEGCCCPHCMEEFHKHLEKKYGTIDELNRKWNLNLFSQAYDRFDEIPPANRAWHNPHLIYEWKTFQNESHIRFVHMQADILGKYVSAPIGTDMMPINGLDYEKVNEKLDVVMFNHYNTEENLGDSLFWFDFLRTIKDRPFWNTETSTCWNGSEAIHQVMKPEGFCRINSWLPVALGGEANLYWLWRQHWAGHELVHGALLYPSKRPFHIFGEVQTVAKQLDQASDFLTDTAVDTPIALHFTSKNWNLLEAQPVFGGFHYSDRLVQDFHLPLTRMGLRPDVIGAKKDLSPYKILLSPYMLTLEDGDLPARIEEWVKNGGIWIAGPMTDIRNAIGAHYRENETGMIENLSGCELTYSIPDGKGYLTTIWSDGTVFKGNHWFELYTPGREANSMVSVTAGHSAVVGKSVVTQIGVGKGKILLLGSIPSEQDLVRIVRLAAEEAGVDIPEVTGNVAVVPRVGKGRRGLILAEYGNAGASCVLKSPMTDILSGKSYDGKVELAPYEILILEE